MTTMRLTRSLVEEKVLSRMRTLSFAQWKELKGSKKLTTTAESRSAALDVLAIAVETRRIIRESFFQVNS